MQSQFLEHRDVNFIVC